MSQSSPDTLPHDFILTLRHSTCRRYCAGHCVVLVGDILSSDVTKKVVSLVAASV